MKGGPRLVWKTASLTALTCGLVLAVALGSSRSAARVGGSTSPARWPDFAGDVFVVVVAFALVSLALIVYVLWSAGRRARSENEHVRRLFPISRAEKLVVVLLGLVVIGSVVTGLYFASGDGGGRAGERPPPLGPGAGAPDPIGGRVSPDQSFGVDWWVFAGLAAFAVGALVLLVASRRRADTANRAAVESAGRETLRAALEGSLEEITRETDPRQAVIRAYRKMEQILAQHGLGRFPHEAPFEYLERALAAIRLSRAAAERLTDLFVRARFSQHTVDQGLKEDAIAALDAVRDELRAEAR